MSNINTECGADIVIQATIGGYNLWHDGVVIANLSPKGRDFILSDTSKQQCSIFDYDRGEFICGTLDQLDR